MIRGEREPLAASLAGDVPRPWQVSLDHSFEPFGDVDYSGIIQMFCEFSMCAVLGNICNIPKIDRTIPELAMHILGRGHFKNTW